MLKFFGLQILSALMGMITLIWVYGNFSLPAEAYMLVTFLFFWFYLPVILYFSLLYYFFIKKD